MVFPLFLRCFGTAVALLPQCCGTVVALLSLCCRDVFELLRRGFCPVVALLLRCYRFVIVIALFFFFAAVALLSCCCPAVFAPLSRFGSFFFLLILAQHDHLGLHAPEQHINANNNKLETTTITVRVAKMKYDSLVFFQSKCYFRLIYP